MKKMSLSLVLISTTTLVVSLLGCGGGGYSRFRDPGLKLCAKDYKPIEQEIPVSNKVSKKSWPGMNGQDPSLEPGDYEYSSMEYYIQDTGTDLQFYITETKDVSGNRVVNRVCSREILDIGNNKETLEFPSSVNIGSGGKMTTQTKTLTIQHTDRIEVTVSDPVDQSLPPSKVTDDQHYESQLYQVTADDGTLTYELRMKDDSGPVKRFAVIRYEKKSTAQ